MMNLRKYLLRLDPISTKKEGNKNINMKENYFKIHLVYSKRINLKRTIMY